MGCDIHFYIEKLIAGKWKNITLNKYYINRNYILFGALAGIRSDFVVPPILPRGFPEDASNALKKEYYKWKGEAHTPSYLSFEELNFIKNIKIDKELYLSLSDYRKCLKEPLDYYYYYYFLTKDDIEGIDALVNKRKIISKEEADKRVNLSAFIDDEKYLFTKANPSIFNYIGTFFKTIDDISSKHKDISKLRCVFWFDN